MMNKNVLIFPVLLFISLSCSTSRNYYDKNFLLSRNTYKIWYSFDRKQGVIFHASTKTVDFFDENFFLIPLHNIDGISYSIEDDTICFKYRPFFEKQEAIEKFVIMELSDNHLCLYNEKKDTISMSTYVIQDTLPLTNPELSNNYIKPKPLFSDCDVVSLLDSVDIEKNELSNYRLVLYIDSQGSIKDAMILKQNKAVLPSTIEEKKIIETIKKNLRYKAASDKRTGRNYSTKVLLEVKRGATGTVD